VLTDFFSVLDATATTEMTGNPFARLVIPVLTGFFFGDLKQKKRIPEDFFFYCVFWRNFSQERHLEGVAVIPVSTSLRM
jgi:hypothetical protein